MEIVLKPLVLHSYQSSDLCPFCVPNLVKRKEWHFCSYDIKYRYYSEDIDKSDIVYSLQIDDTNDIFALVFINNSKIQNGEKLYVIEKIIFDHNLSSDTVKDMIMAVLQVEIEGDNLVRCHIKAISLHSFYESTKQVVFGKIASEIQQAFIDNKDGITSNPRILDIIELINKNGIHNK